MTVTLNDLYAELESFLSGYTIDLPKVTSLTADVAAIDTTFVCDDLVVDRGLAEIDDELVAVKSQDATSGTVVLYPWGRGQRATTAAAHTAGSRVTSNPRFPRAQMKQEINESISTLYPDLFSVGVDTSNATSPAVLAYPVPASAEDVVSVAYQSIGPSKVWVQCRRFRFDFTADASSFPTGKSVTIADRMLPGRTLQIVYRGGFGQLSAGTDTLASAGVKDDWRDIIKLQAAAKMLMSLDSARLQDTSVEGDSRNAQILPSQAVQIAQRLMQMAQVRIDGERRQLYIEYPQRAYRAGI